MTPASRTQADLTALFTLERCDDHRWRGHNDPLPLPQLFGGQLVAQSLVAAGRDLEAHRSDDAALGGALGVHSIHTVFLRRGLTEEPVEYAVTELFSGRSRAACQVGAWQGGRLVCSSLVSAGADDPGIAHARPAPEVGPVAAAVPLSDLAEQGLGEFWLGFEAIDVLVAAGGSADAAGEGEAPAHSAAAPRNFWMRSAKPLPDDPLLHRAAVAYASDLMLFGTAAAPHGVRTGDERRLAAEWRGLSLDHAIWFQGEVRGDDWLLYEHVTPMAHASRVLIQAAAFDSSGRPVCQIAQEGLLRRQEAFRNHRTRPPTLP